VVVNEEGSSGRDGGRVYMYDGKRMEWMNRLMNCGCGLFGRLGPMGR
jgi:hypothetical protein